MKEPDVGSVVVLSVKEGQFVTAARRSEFYADWYISPITDSTVHRWTWEDLMERFYVVVAYDYKGEIL